MSDLVAQFAALLRKTNASGGSIDVLLAQLEPAAARLLRMCAITHQFNEETLRVLDPSLSEAQAAERFEQFANLSTVIATPDGLALHDGVRQHLFAQWLESAELRAVSERLVAWIETELQNDIPATEHEKLQRRRIFHRIAIDQNAGIDEFENEFERYRERTRFTACFNLLRMVQEYDRVLSDQNRARVVYRHAKLAFDRAQLDDAERLYAETRDIPHSDTLLRMKAWNGLGNTYDVLQEWEKAASAYTRALQLAELEKSARPFRCRILRNLGAVQRDTGNLDAAEKLLLKSLAMAEEMKDVRGEAITRNALGALYIRTEEPEKAVAYLESSLEDLAVEDFQRARVYNNLGLAHRKQREYELSLRWYTRSLELKKMGGDTLGQARTWTNIVVLHGEQRATDKAIEAARKAAELFASVYAWRDAGNAWLTLARLYEMKKSYEKANAALLAAIDAYEHAHADAEIQRAKDEFEERRRFVNRKTEKILTRVSLGVFVLAIIFVIVLLLVLLPQWKS